MSADLDGRRAAASCLLRTARTDELPTLISIDDDACCLFDEIGLGLGLSPGHAAFIEAEKACWASAAASGRVLVAQVAGDLIGFAVLDVIDGEAYLAQISVRRAHMRRGVGQALLAHAIDWSSTIGSLWLTTYGHVAWNRPYYERFGFLAVAESGCGEQVNAVLRAERRALPAPEHRIAMVFRHCLNSARDTV